MKAYSIDLRERVLAACDQAEGTREQVAKRFGVSLAWVYRLRQRHRQTGSIAPRPHGGGQRPAFDAAAADRLRQAVADRPDATLVELRATVGVACGTSATQRMLGKLGLTRKKSRTGPPSRTPPG